MVKMPIGFEQHHVCRKGDIDGRTFPALAIFADTHDEKGNLAYLQIFADQVIGHQLLFRSSVDDAHFCALAVVQTVDEATFVNGIPEYLLVVTLYTFEVDGGIVRTVVDVGSPFAGFGSKQFHLG